jgi:hypothetical protein
VSTYVAVFALVLSYGALVSAYLALRTLARLRRSSSVLSRGVRGGAGRDSLVEATARQAELIGSVRDEVAEVRAAVVALGARLDEHAAGTADADGLSNVALVRYDAFDGVAGRLSFSLALLDAEGDGVTISALAGRADTGVYAKPVSAGAASGDPTLSPEERQAVDAALGRRRRRPARTAS